MGCPLCAGGSVIWEPCLAMAIAAGTPCGGFEVISGGVEALDEWCKEVLECSQELREEWEESLFDEM